MDTWNYRNRAWQRESCYVLGGNGYWGARIPLDGHGANGNPFCAEIANFYVSEVERMVNVPHPLCAPLWFNGEAVQPVWNGAFCQNLDLKTGILQTTYNEKHHQVQVQTEFFFHRAHQHIAVYQLEVTALQDGGVVLAPQLSLAHLRQNPQVERQDDGWMLNFGDEERCAAQALRYRIVQGAGEEKRLDGDGLGSQLTFSLRAGQSIVVEVFVSTTVGASPVEDARREVEQAVETGFENLKIEQEEAMAVLWRHFDFECDDPFTTRRARSAFYYLLTSFRDDVAWGGAATGLAGSDGDWAGCVFWDSDFYMFPALLPLLPSIAKQIPLYRWETREGAADNARHNGEPGWRYAWESRRSGREFAKDFAAERHVSSDVVFAAWWYAQSSGDSSFWRDCGREMLLQVARNWAGRARYDEAKQVWHIAGVIPSDEHVWDHYRGTTITDSVMTNAYAAWVLNEAAEEFPMDPDAPRWRDIAKRIVLPRDEERGLWLEYEGYDAHPIKQADVGHLFFPLRSDDKPQDIVRNVNFYADRERETGIGILHSPFVYAAAMSRAGDVEGVRRFLDQSWQNVAGAYDVPRELLHTTSPTVSAAGAFLGLLIYGVLGLENQGETLEAHPCVPEYLGEVKLRGLQFRGATYQISARGKEAKIECIS